MELISKDHQSTTVKFTTVEFVNVLRVLTGVVEEYKSLDEEIIGVTQDYVQKLNENLHAFLGGALSE